MLNDPLTIFVVLLAVIFLSLQITQRSRLAARLSPVFWILMLGAVASNTGVIPLTSSVYNSIVGFSVPFAVSVILFKVRLADLKNAGKGMLAAFGLAMLGTVVGVVIAGLVLSPALGKVLGDQAWKLAGPYTGTYIGGSLNFFALWEGLEIGDSNLFAAANAVDNLTLFPLFAFWILIPARLGSRFPVAERWRTKADPGQSSNVASKSADKETPELRPADLITLSLLAFGVILASQWILEHWIHPVAPAVPSILVVTTLALIAGQLPPVQRLEGAWQLGEIAFYLFFAAVGAMIHIYQAIVLSPVLFVYVSIIIVVHMVTIFGLGRLLGLDLGVLTIASVAAKAGPAMVAPLCEVHGWKHLVLPGVAVGLLGYGLGNYIGFGVAYLMRTLLGG